MHKSAGFAVDSLPGKKHQYIPGLTLTGTGEFLGKGGMGSLGEGLVAVVSQLTPHLQPGTAGISHVWCP